MPTTYAHWAFGRDCIEEMPENLQSIIHAHRDIYNLGVHGPDILFYDLMHSDIVKYGNQLHSTPMNVFFKNCKEAFKSHEEKEEMLAYMMGFLTHFTLDSACHSYIAKKVDVSPVSHFAIEAEWDKHVIELDRRTPNLVDRAESLRPNKKNAKIISYFYPYNQKTILRTTKWQLYTITLLNSISHKKEDYFKKLFKSPGTKKYLDLFMSYNDDPDCRDSNLRLDKLRAKALKLFPKLMENLLFYLDDKQELIDYFDHDLCEWPNYKDIEVLPYKQEIDYKVK